MIQKILLATAAFFVISGLIFTAFWMSLSTELLTSFVEAKGNENLPKEYKLKIESAETTLWGLGVENIKILNKHENSELIRIQSAHISFNLIRILFSLGIPYSLELYNGEVDGVIRFFPNLQTNFDIQSLEPKRIPLLRKSNLLLSNPIVNVSAEIQSLQPLIGEFNIQIQKLKLSGKPEHTGIPLTFPNTSLTTVSANLKVENKLLDLDLNSKGDINANLNGKIQSNWKRFNRSSINLALNATFEKKYYDSLGFIQQIIKGYMNEAGKLALQINGKLQSPSLKKL